MKVCASVHVCSVGVSPCLCAWSDIVVWTKILTLNLSLPEVTPSPWPCRELLWGSNQTATGLPPACLFMLFNQRWSTFQKSSSLHMKAAFVFDVGEAGETRVGAQQLSVCTLQAGSVCSVDAGGVSRVSALSSVPYHGYVCACVCLCVCVCWMERGQVGGAEGLTHQCGQVEDSH